MLPNLTKKCRFLEFSNVYRERLYEQVESLRSTKSVSLESTDTLTWDSDSSVLGSDQEFLEENRNEELQYLRKEVKSLAGQVKHMKRILVLSVFKSKQEFADFFSDIW